MIGVLERPLMHILSVLSAFNVIYVFHYKYLSPADWDLKASTATRLNNIIVLWQEARLLSGFELMVIRRG